VFVLAGAALVLAPAGAEADAASTIAVSVGYYDTHHAGDPQPKPDPWQGSPNVVFAGQADTQSGGWDTSAVRVDNLTNAPIKVVVTVIIGSDRFHLWGKQTIPVGDSLIVAQTGLATFDGSDTNPAGCFDCDPHLCDTEVSAKIPVVRVLVAGVVIRFRDRRQILNTHGVDSAGCPYTGTRNDESEAWQLLG
jgi:hypothetical protein